jgi:membrane protein DedA with SNARE-associated domain
MNFLAAILWATVYVFLGVYLEDGGFIIAPAYWSMYGWTFGILFLVIILGGKENP